MLAAKSRTDCSNSLSIKRINHPQRNCKTAGDCLGFWRGFPALVEIAAIWSGTLSSELKS